MDSMSITHQVAVYDGFDEAKDIGDHFASNPSNTGWTSTGGGRKNLKLET